MNLNVENISKSFGESTVLKDISFQLHSGEILSLTGESGCGKSTLLRIISGLEIPNKGKVILNGTDITNWPPEKRRFGYVFQNLSLFPHLTVAQNIFFAISKKDRSNTPRLSQLLDMTGLSGLGERFPHQLSGGQQQRVALARALAIDPKLLILDEPFSSLDELIKTKIREDVMNLLRELKITTILVSHQPTDAFLIADQLIIMKEGTVQQKGTPNEVYSFPVSRYVSDFFGASVIINGNGNDDMVETAFGNLKIPHEKRDGLQLFVRPEHVAITDSSNYNLTGKVAKKEFKGPHDVLKIRAADVNEYFSIETERCSIQVGETIYLNVPEQKIQVFK
ncbi:MAG: ABC transporter ATP-binding protein [Ekhidna sp.]